MRLTQSVVDPPVRPALTGESFFSIGQSGLVSQGGGREGAGRQSERLTTWSDSLTVYHIMAAESMEQLLNAELREAFDEFDKVNRGLSIEKQINRA